MKNRLVSGVPGFSDRLNEIFDLAGAPVDSRLSWGAAKWNVVPNTVRNWLRLDTPPQQYLMLDRVVSDLLSLFENSVNRASVIGWLFAGGSNSFAPHEITNLDKIEYVDLFELYKVEIIKALDGGEADRYESLYSAFLITGEIIVKQFIFDGVMRGDKCIMAQRKFLEQKDQILDLLKLGKLYEKN